MTHLEQLKAMLEEVKADFEIEESDYWIWVTIFGVDGHGQRVRATADFRFTPGGMLNSVNVDE